MIDLTKIGAKKALPEVSSGEKIEPGSFLKEVAKTRNVKLKKLNLEYTQMF
jgi:hypothetical protein